MMLTRRLKTIYSHKLDELFATGEYFDGGKQSEIHEELLMKMDDDEREAQVEKEERTRIAAEEKQRLDEERRQRQSAEERSRIELELEDLLASASARTSTGALIPEITHVGFFEKMYFSDYYYVLVPHGLQDLEARKMASAAIKWADKQTSYHFPLEVFDDAVDMGGVIANKEHVYELVVFRSDEGRVAPAMFHTKRVTELYAEMLSIVSDAQEHLDERIRRYEFIQPDDVKFSREVGRLVNDVRIERRKRDEKEMR